MAELATFLSRASDIQAPVTDRTGLTGKFDFEMSFLVEGEEGAPARYSGFAAAESVGLKLKAARGEASVLVIGKIHKPTEN